MARAVGSSYYPRMTYRILSLAGGAVDAIEQTGSLETARLLAMNYVKDGAAERAEVRDDAGALVFHYPGVTRNA
ncbi:MAG: hypothetical protein JWM33_1559 [Caulobacteraceae bacterium]|nr:hypothetical protein [Caulobacteraceae bacterium]